MTTLNTTSVPVSLCEFWTLEVVGCRLCGWKRSARLRSGPRVLSAFLYFDV